MVGDTVKALLRRADGKILSVDPADKDVIQLRPAGGAWEEVELTEHADGFSARFIAADVLLCMTPSGELQTRPAGSRGAWETVEVAEQPDPVKTLLMFRREPGSFALPVLFVEVLAA